MKKILITLTLLLCLQVSSGQSEITYFNDANIRVNAIKNIELLGLAHFLYYEYNTFEQETVKIKLDTKLKKDWENYRYYLYQKFGKHKSSIHLKKIFDIVGHLELDYLINFIAQMTSIPDAQFYRGIPKEEYLDFSKSRDMFEAQKKLMLFLESFNAFSKEIDFEGHLALSLLQYEQAAREVHGRMAQKYYFDIMEKFYKKSFDKYIMTPSLTLPKGSSFRIKIVKNGKTKVYSIFGAVIEQKFDDPENLAMGFLDFSEMKELSWHQFGHFFVEPEIDKIPDEVIEKTSYMMKEIEKSMKFQGINTWKECLNEHFVRAGELLMSKEIGKIENQSHLPRALLTNYTNLNRLLYISLVMQNVGYYQRGRFETYFEAVEKFVYTIPGSRR